MRCQPACQLLKMRRKAGQDEQFCTGCGQRIIALRQRRRNSLSCGIFSLFMGWIPVLGWLFIFFLALLRFPVLRLDQARKRALRKEVWQLQELFWVSSRCFLLSLRLMGMIYGNAPQAGTPLMNTDIPLAMEEKKDVTKRDYRHNYSYSGSNFALRGINVSSEFKDFWAVQSPDCRGNNCSCQQHFK